MSRRPKIVSAIAPSQRTMRTANFISRCPSRCGACARSNSEIRRTPNASSFLIAAIPERVGKKEARSCALRVVSYPLSVIGEAGGDAAEERLHGRRWLPHTEKMSPLLIKISKDLKLVRCPRSLAPTLVTLPSMSLIPSAPFLIIPKFTEPEKAFLCMDLSRRTRTQNQLHQYTCPLPADKDSWPYPSGLGLELRRANQLLLFLYPQLKHAAHW